MVDELGRGKPNTVKHRKMLYEMDLSGLNPYGDSSGSGKVDYTSQAFRDYVNFYYLDLMRSSIGTWDMSPTLSGMPTGWSVNETAVNESQVIENLFAAARQLKADVLLNVVEANQIFPSIKSLASYFPEMGRNWFRLRQVLARSSGAYLAWKFGVGPIIQDLKSIAVYAPDMGNQFKRFANQEKQRFSRVVPLQATFTLPSTVSNAANGNPFERKTYQGRQLGKAEVRYVLVVQPNVPAKSDFFKKLNFVCARFTTSPASLAWELIPFSFMVDWFVDLRGVLRGIDNLVTVQPYRVISLTKSLRYALATDAILEPCSPCTAGGSVLSKGSVSVEFEHYERSSLSASASLPTLSGRFGKNQAGIAAALITQALSGARANRSLFSHTGG